MSYLYKEVIRRKNPFEQNALSLSMLFHGLKTAIFHTSPLKTLQYFCLFVGHPRSGSTLVASLLDAHPHITIAHELHALNLVRLHVPTRLLFELCIQSSKEFTRNQRIWSEYSYHVPNFHREENLDTLHVLGDKKAGRSAIFLAHIPGLLERLRKCVGVPLRIIHVVRHSLDNITTHAKRSKLNVSLAIDHYFRICESVDKTQTMLGVDEWHRIHLEEFISTPEESLKSLCNFLGQACTEEYVEAAKHLVFTEPRKTRSELPWSSDDISLVKQSIENHPYLLHYDYDI